MALVLSTYDDRLDITFAEAYYRISDVRYNTSSIDFNVLMYANETARNASKQELTNKVYALAYTPGDEAMANLYTHLKTLSEFSGAVDA